MSTINNIEEIRKSSQLKKEKCEEVKAAMRDILSDEQKKSLTVFLIM